MSELSPLMGETIFGQPTPPEARQLIEMWAEFFEGRTGESELEAEMRMMRTATAIQRELWPHQSYMAQTLNDMAWIAGDKLVRGELDE